MTCPGPSNQSMAEPRTQAAPSPNFQLPLWDGSGTKAWGQTLSQTDVLPPPSCSGGAHCQEDCSRPPAHQHPSQPACSTGAQSPIRALLWAELGGMSKGRAEEWPQFTGTASSAAHKKESRMLSLPCKDALLISPTPSPCLLVILVQTPWHFLFPLPSPPPSCPLRAQYTMSAGATGPQKAAVPTEGMPLTHPDSPLRNLSLASCSRT